jgi:hypothetical protein
MNKKGLISLLGLAFCFSIFAQRPIEIKVTYDPDGSCQFSYTKSLHGSMYLEINFSKADNFVDPNFKSVVIATSGNLFKLKRIDPNKPLDLSYKIWYVRGMSTLNINTNVQYALPISSGKATKVRYLNFLKTAKETTEPKNWCSFQFSGSPGDTVYAVRKGVVVSTTNQYDVSTEAQYSFRSQSNFILVEHSDGTLAKYSVLKKDSYLTKEGNTVYPGTPLALMGTYDVDDNTQLRLAIYYLDKEALSPDNRQSDKKTNYYIYLNPVFYTCEGAGPLMSGSTYKAQITDKLKTQEMTKKEKKKFDFSL